MLASDKKAQEKIAARADEIANVRKGRDGLAASFYVKTLRHLILEKDGSKYVREELKGISDTLASVRAQGFSVRFRSTGVVSVWVRVRFRWHVQCRAFLVAACRVRGVHGGRYYVMCVT